MCNLCQFYFETRNQVITRHTNPFNRLTVTEIVLVCVLFLVITSLANQNSQISAFY